MTEPTVCAICLTRDRPELAKRAVECFERQTYTNKRLVIFDTGTGPIMRHRGHLQHCEIGASPQTIGALRNKANGLSKLDEEILIHWDDDDFSHPNRIAEQVALLQASGADCVGYNEMLFWRENFMSDNETQRQEAWLYSFRPPKPTLGTSLCYWRKTWERKPFNPRLPNDFESTGEDSEFIQGLKVAAVSSLVMKMPLKGAVEEEPRMIARIHGGNTAKYNLEESRGDTWKRVPEWDQRMRDILK